MDKSALASGGNLDGGTYELLRNLDGEFLNRLAPLPAYGLVQHLRLSHLKLEALAAHSLDKHGKMKHSASIYYE